MQKVKIDPSADRKLKQLISILYSEKYFAARERAKDLESGGMAKQHFIYF